MKSMLPLLASGALLIVASCSVGDDTAEPDERATSSEVREEIGTLDESLTSVDMVDCSICETARACCIAVNAGSYCDNFSAERCETLDSGRQRTTKLNCLVTLRTTISAWRSAGRTPPSECHIPGE